MSTGWVFLCPGQGSQAVGMGKSLYEAFPLARRRYEEADAILGMGLRAIAFEGPEDVLKQTHNTQPALFTLDVICAELAIANGARPLAAAGHSLGEYAACVVAGAMSFEDGVRLTRLRGELMYEAGVSNPGAMAAVLGLEESAIEAVLATIPGVVEPANLNTPTQTVISGEVEALEVATPRLLEAGASKVVRLAVSGAFHSRLMAPAAEGLSRALRQTPIRDADIPVVTNVNARPARAADELRQALVEQLTARVRWAETMRWFLDSGFDRFVETGPGKVLQGMARQIDRRAEVVGVSSPETIASLRAAASSRAEPLPKAAES